MSSQRKLSHSQNFIKSSELIENLLELTSISAEDLVVEIGPGKGVITSVLLQRARKVIAIEKDPKLANTVRPLLVKGNLELVVADFLTWELPNKDYKIFSNIPFNLTADIVNKLTFSTNLPLDAYLIMQEAAAHRFVGKPFEKNSQISVLIGVNFDVSILREVDRTNFKPRPKVNIAFTHFEQRTNPLIAKENQQEFRDFVVYGFNQWKPTVLEAFDSVFSRKQQSIISRQLGLRGLKPSDLEITQWVQLYETFQNHVNNERKQQVRGSERRLKQEQSTLTKRHRTDRRNRRR